MGQQVQSSTYLKGNTELELFLPLVQSIYRQFYFELLCPSSTLICIALDHISYADSRLQLSAQKCFKGEKKKEHGFNVFILSDLSIALAV